MLIDELSLLLMLAIAFAVLSHVCLLTSARASSASHYKSRPICGKIDSARPGTRPTRMPPVRDVTNSKVTSAHSIHFIDTCQVSQTQDSHTRVVLGFAAVW